MPTINPQDLDGRGSYRLLTSIVTPRPIAWISTISDAGQANIAPYSFFNAVAGDPPTVMFSVGQRREIPKDTLVNLRQIPEFVVHMVDEAHADAMNLTSKSLGYGESEFELAGLESVASDLVKPPRLPAVPVAMEGRVTQMLPIQDTPNVAVFGQIVRFHIQDGLLTDDGIVQTPAMRLIGRLGGGGYVKTQDVFELVRPALKMSSTTDTAR